MIGAGALNVDAGLGVDATFTIGGVFTIGEALTTGGIALRGAEVAGASGLELLAAMAAALLLEGSGALIDTTGPGSVIAGSAGGWTGTDGRSASGRYASRRSASIASIFWSVANPGWPSSPSAARISTDSSRAPSASSHSLLSTSSMPSWLKVIATKECLVPKFSTRMSRTSPSPSSAPLRSPPAWRRSA